MKKLLCKLLFHLKYVRSEQFTQVTWDADYKPSSMCPSPYELEWHEVEVGEGSCTKIEYFKSCYCGHRITRTFLDYEA